MYSLNIRTNDYKKAYNQIDYKDKAKNSYFFEVGKNFSECSVYSRGMFFFVLEFDLFVKLVNKFQAAMVVESS